MMHKQKTPSPILPPQWPFKLLRRVIKAPYLEEIEGDMAERFHDNLQFFTPRKAKRMYVWDTLKLVRPALLKSLGGDLRSNQYGLFKHNLTLAFRNFKRHKTSFLINVLGLSSGLACVLFIYLWVNDELSVDQFYDNDHLLYQVLVNRQENEIITSKHTPGILANALNDEVPEVAVATSVVPSSWFENKQTVSYEDQYFSAAAQYVDQNYFQVFSTEFLAGGEIEKLPNKSSMVISDDFALKLFDDVEDAVGKTVLLDQGSKNRSFQIVGVYKAPPSNATDQFDFLIDIGVFLEGRPWLSNWQNSDPSTFVLLKEGTNIDLFNRKIEGFMKAKSDKVEASLFLQRYAERYLNGTYENGQPVGGRIAYVRLYSIVAVFILLIACINFITLSTAQASRRVKEVGVKKAIGARRRALVYQYLGESLLLATISFVLAFLLVLVFLPQFNAVMGKALTLTYDANVLLWALGILLTTGLVSGSYPALYLSRFHTIEALKKQAGALSSSLGELMVRKSLVIFQFALSTLLIISVVVIYQQMDYIQSKNLGYDRDNIVYFNMPAITEDVSDEEYNQRIISYQEELKNLPGVVHVTSASHDLTGNNGEFWGIDWQEGDEDESIHFRNLEVGYGFMETFGITVLQGRAFSKAFGAEQSNILINQKAAEIMGFEEPVSQKVRFWGEDKRIIGVAGDFHFESLHDQLKPCIIQLYSSERIAVKINGEAIIETLSRLEAVFQGRFPGYPFDFHFLDQDYQALYEAEQRVATLSKYFAGIAIIISCLGLFGLASFTAERRTKEIGVRKVLGANLVDIIKLLSSDFNRIVLIAIAIALPVGFMIASNWLEQFAYRVALHWSWFALVSIATLLVAWLVIGWQTFKVAVVNPVECLRDE